MNIPGGSFSILLDDKSMQKPFTLIIYQRRSKWASACQWENHIDITRINYRAKKVKQFYMFSFLAILQIPVFWGDEMEEIIQFFLRLRAGGVLQILQSDWFRERAVFFSSILPANPGGIVGTFSHKFFFSVFE